jgi:hypothetical protein
MVPKLYNMIGNEIFISTVSSEALEKVKLLGVETGGIWIESKTLTDGFLALSESKVLPNTPMVFLPYSRLKGIIGVIEGAPSFDEKALGL